MSFVFAQFPLRLLQPDWYLRLFASFAQGSPILIAAFSFGISAILITDSSRVSRYSLLFSLRRCSRILVIASLIILPLQVILSARFANQNLNASRAERSRIVNQQSDFNTLLQQASSKQDFLLVLQSKGIGVDLSRLESISLADAKQRSANIVNQQFNRQLIDLKKNRKQRFITDIVDAVKLFISWLAILLFFSFSQKITKRLTFNSGFSSSSFSSNNNI